MANLAFPEQLFPVCHIGEGEKETVSKSVDKVWDYHQRLNQTEYGRLSGLIINEDKYFRNFGYDHIVHYYSACIPLSYVKAIPFEHTFIHEMSDKVMEHVVAEQYRYFKRTFNHTYFPVERLISNITKELTVARDTQAMEPCHCSVVSYIPCWLPSKVTNGSTIEGYLIYANGPNMNDYNKIALIGIRCGYYIGFFEGPSKDTEILIKKSSTNDSLRVFNLMTPLKLYQTSVLTSCICLCPYYYGEAIFITESGGLYLWDIDVGISIIQSPLIAVSTNELSHMWRCVYGPKPACVILCEFNCVSVVDFSGGELVYTTIIKQGSCYITTDWVISAIANHPCNPFYIFVATSDKILLFDLRQFQEPLLEIRHELPKLIHYMDVVCCSWQPQEVIVMVSSLHGPFCQAIKIKGGFSFSNDENVLPPQVSNTVHSIDTYKNFIEELDLSSSYLITRLSQPLAGTCIIPLTISCHFCAIMTSMIGDMFYQCWYYDKPPPKISSVVPHVPLECRMWAEEVITVEKEKSKNTHVSTGDKNLQVLQNFVTSSLADKSLCLKCVSLIQEGMGIGKEGQTLINSSVSPPTHEKCDLCCDDIHAIPATVLKHPTHTLEVVTGKAHLDHLMGEFNSEELCHLWKQWDIEKECVEDLKEQPSDIMHTFSEDLMQPRKKFKVQNKGF